MAEKVIEESINEEKRSIGKIIINIFIIILIIFVGTIMYARFIGVKGLNVREYRISSDSIPSNFSGIKIVHFSDLLYGSSFDMKDTRELVLRINELKPDLVFFTGGLISEYANISDEEVEELGSFLKSIDATIGKYAVRGNEDKDEFEIIMSHAEFIVLNNTGTLVYNKGLKPIYVGGLPSSIKDAVNINGIFESILTDENASAYFKILLMHEGDSVNFVLSERDDVDMILAGNSLNGSVILPFYGGVYIPEGSKEYYEEYYKSGRTQIFVSGGLGTGELSYRFNNKPSFNFYRLKSL